MATQKVFIDGVATNVTVPDGATIIGVSGNPKGMAKDLTFVTQDTNGRIWLGHPTMSRGWLVGTTVSLDTFFAKSLTNEQLCKSGEYASILTDARPPDATRTKEVMLNELRASVGNASRLATPSTPQEATAQQMISESDVFNPELRTPSATAAATQARPDERSLSERLNAAAGDAEASRTDFNKGVPGEFRDISGRVYRSGVADTPFNADCGTYVAKEWTQVLDYAAPKLTEDVKDYVKEQRRLMAENTAALVKDPNDTKASQGLADAKANLQEAQGMLDKTGDRFLIGMTSGTRNNRNPNSDHNIGDGFDMPGFSSSDTGGAPTRDVYGNSYSRDARPGSIQALLYQKIPERMKEGGQKLGGGLSVNHLSVDRQGVGDETHFSIGGRSAADKEARKRAAQQLQSHYTDYAAAHGGSIGGAAGVSKALSDKGISVQGGSGSSIGATQGLPTAALKQGVIGNTDKASDVRIKVEDIAAPDEQIKALAKTLNKKKDYQDKLSRNVVRGGNSG
jgi:hypothetical protein